MKKLHLKFLLLIVVSTNTYSQSISFFNFLDSANSITNATDKIAYVEEFLTFAEETGIPFIEGDTANFIYYNEATSVVLAGDFNGWDASNPWICSNISGTNFYYYSETFEPTARLDYKYIIDGSNWILDPLNPNTCTGGYGPNSELAMPGYVQPWEIEEYEGVNKGTIESFNYESVVLSQNFSIQVYLPPDYQSNSELFYQTVYVHDGQEYISLANMNNVIDNLLDSNKIDPIIGVFIKPNNRNDLYAFNDRFDYAKFIAEELVPHIDNNYRTIPYPQSRLTMGASFGGNISGIIAFKYPQKFANSGWHSLALWPNDGEVAYFYTDSVKKDIKLYFNVGTYENLGVDWEFFADGLTNKGYTFDWKTFHEGHSWGLWRATIDDMLEYFFPVGSTPVSIKQFDLNNDNYAKIYPNPANDFATIELKNSKIENYKMLIYNSLGQIIYTFDFSFSSSGYNQISINISELNEGIYYYKVHGTNKKYSGILLKEEK